MSVAWEDDPSLLVDGKYFLECEIGQGGMGRVWRALQVGLNRHVAVKFLEIHGQGTEGTPATDEEKHESVKRFEREAHALAKLSHPGIVHVFEHGLDGDLPYIAMELVEGRSLAAIAVEGKPLPAAQILQWGLELADCLDHAHTRGILHRDIKPSNVLLEAASERIRLLDFGIARALKKDLSLPTLTRASRVAGTPGYLAPELLLGAAPETTQDIYALGGTLFALSNQVPESDAKKTVLMSLIKRMIAIDPKDRPASMRELYTEFSTLLNDNVTVQVQALAQDEEDEAESLWRSAMALLCTSTTAVGLWAVLLGLTPKVVTDTELLPLTYLVNEKLPDGRLVSLARFETAPVLAFLAALALTMLAFGFLRAYWTRHPLLQGSASRSSASRWVLTMGLSMVAIHALRMLSERNGTPFLPPSFARYVAPIGGVMEIVMLFALFRSLLHTARIRALRFGRTDWRLLLGVTLSFVPPTHAFFMHLQNWKP
jgi:eukaryotic-like serine/threonine-protein kinase